MSENIFDCHNWDGVYDTVMKVNAQRHAMHTKPPTAKKYPASNASTAKLEKHRFRVMRRKVVPLTKLGKLGEGAVFKRLW